MPHDISLQEAFLNFRQERLKLRSIQKTPISVNRHGLRQKFLSKLQSYTGTYYCKKYCQNCSSNNDNCNLHLDCVGLIRQCLRDLAEDFGFCVGPWNQSYYYDMLPSDSSNVENYYENGVRIIGKSSAIPGDLIFYRAKYKSPSKSQKHDVVHVEVFIGPNNESYGSRWKKKSISHFNHFLFKSVTYDIYEVEFKSIDPWLNGVFKCYCNVHNELFSSYSSMIHSDKYSIFYIPDEDGGGDDEEEDVKTTITSTTTTNSDANSESNSNKIKNKNSIYIDPRNNHSLVLRTFKNLSLEKEYISGKFYRSSNLYSDFGGTSRTRRSSSTLNRRHTISELNISNDTKSSSVTIPSIKVSTPINNSSIKGLSVIWLESRCQLNISMLHYSLINPNIKVIVNKFQRFPLTSKNGYHDIVQYLRPKPNLYLTSWKLPITINMTNSNGHSIPPNKHKSKYFIYKPSGGNCGKGIFIFKKEDIIKSIENIHSGIIQSYIERPLLIDECKTDIRLYLLLVDGVGVYYYPNGYIRRSLSKYDISNLKKVSGHLTNQAVQKVKNKSQYDLLKENSVYELSYLNELFGQDDYCSNYLHPKLKEFIKKIFTPLLPSSNIENQYSRRNSLQIKSWDYSTSTYNNFYCFELLGFDVLIDSSGKYPYVLEFNANPALHTNTKILKQIIPVMLKDAMKIVLSRGKCGDIGHWEKLIRI